MASIDWIAIKNEYINGNISYRKLAEKYDISFNTLQKRARKELWNKERKMQCDKVTTKVLQKSAEMSVKNEINRIEKILELNDIACEKIEIALSQLDEYLTPSGVIKNKHIDVDRLKKLTSSLRDSRDVAHEDKSTNNTDTLQKLVEGLIDI